MARRRGRRFDGGAAVIDLVQPYTMLPRVRLHALALLVRGHAGVLVQCGTWNGGSAALMSLVMPASDVWLFDSFQGLPEPMPEDGKRARYKFTTCTEGQWCRGSEAAVHEVFNLINHPPAHLHVVPGMLQDTLVGLEVTPAPTVLHVDVDFLAATRLVLQHFCPTMAPGSLVIADDYGHWQGARRACNEFFGTPGESLAEDDPTHYWVLR